MGLEGEENGGSVVGNGGLFMSKVMEGEGKMMEWNGEVELWRLFEGVGEEVVSGFGLEVEVGKELGNMNVVRGERGREEVMGVWDELEGEGLEVRVGCLREEEDGLGRVEFEEIEE